MALWNYYDNINFFLKRNTKYNPLGRNQTEYEAKVLDEKILNMLHTKRIAYRMVTANPQEIYNYLVEPK